MIKSLAISGSHTAVSSSIQILAGPNAKRSKIGVLQSTPLSRQSLIMPTVSCAMLGDALFMCFFVCTELCCNVLSCHKFC